MKELWVHTARSYPIYMETGLLQKCAELIRRRTKAHKILLIADSHVEPLYAEPVQSLLEAVGFEVFRFCFPAGEASKTLDTVSRILAVATEQGLTRQDLFVALGGGVTGDIVGFVASIYLRGIDFVQIPTTLLAQIDSSVGGKTGVDLPQGKNLCGSFWQPLLVIIDPNLLHTLPDRFFIDGLAEAVKYACIASPSLFTLLQEDPKAHLQAIIAECVTLKRDIVQADEKDTGQRMLLNFGHTLGHALEKHYHFEGLSHGEAVAIGMAVITKASEARGITQPGTYARLLALLQKHRLPTSDPAPLPELIQNACADKKRMGDSLQLVLLESIGRSKVQAIPLAQLAEFLSDH